MVTNDSRTRLKVAAISDERCALQMTVMLRSMIDHLSPSSFVDLYLIDCGLSDYTKEAIEKSLDCSRLSIDYVPPAIPPALSLPLWGDVSVAPYCKLFLPDSLPDSIDKVILLDCDLVVNHDITELWNINMNGKTILAVQDMAIPFVSSKCGLSSFTDFKLSPEAKYFNSGVMLMDLQRWKMRQLSQKCLDFLTLHGKEVHCFDQDVFNAICAEDWSEIPPQWNRIYSVCNQYFAHVPHLNKEDAVSLSKHSWITHFAGTFKPTRVPIPDEICCCYYQIISQTAWAGWRPKKSPAVLFLYYYLTSFRRYLYRLERIYLTALRFLTFRFSASFKGSGACSQPRRGWSSLPPAAIPQSDRKSDATGSLSDIGNTTISSSANSESDYAVLYYFWGKKSCLSLEYPLILSIASLRAKNASIPILVLDSSPRKIDWFHFPSKLNFEVVRWTPLLRWQPFRGQVFWGHCSKVFDIEVFAKNMPQSNIIFCDSDIFWIKNVLPLLKDGCLNRFCCRPENTGFFYFSKSSPLVEEVFRRWKAAIVAAIDDRTTRREVWKACNLDLDSSLPLHDEMAHHYIFRQELECEIPLAENFRLKPDMDRESLKTAKNIHAMKIFWPQNRGLLCLYIRDIFENISSVLTGDDLHLIFGKDYPSRMTFSIQDLASKDRYFELQKLLS